MWVHFCTTILPPNQPHHQPFFLLPCLCVTVKKISMEEIEGGLPEKWLQHGQRDAHKLQTFAFL